MPSHLCTICNSLDSKLCASCSSAAYCSVECQQTDWPLHKIPCKAMKAVPTRPDAAHKLGILFPQDANTPQLVWINCKRSTNSHLAEEDYTLETPDIAHLMGPDPYYINDMLIQHNMLRSFDLDHTLRLNYRDTFLQDGSKKNRSVAEPPQGLCVMIGAGPY